MNNKMSAEELAVKLEQKAKSLREHGLSNEDMDKVVGGYACECCGSSCQTSSSTCVDTQNMVRDCVRSCVKSSPD